MFRFRTFVRPGRPEARRYRLRRTLSAILGLGLLTACADPSPTPPDTSPSTTQRAPGEGAHEAADGDHDAHDGEERVVELSEAAARQIDIEVAPVRRQTLASQLRTTGQVDFDETRLAHVSPRVSGRVHRVEARLGQRVNAGEQLAQIDSIDLGRTKSEYLQARAKSELARKSYDRARDLFEDQITSEQTLLEAETEVLEASADLRTAEEELRLYGMGQKAIDALLDGQPVASIYPLRAPFSGTIIERHATLGELVTPERNLFTLADLSRVWIWIDVYQRDLGRVHVDDGARATVDAFPDEVFEGRVSFLSARVDTDTRTVRARLEVANPRGRLRPGMFVEVELTDPHAQTGYGRADSSLVVPETAVVRDGEGHWIFVDEGNGRYVARDVRLGRATGGVIEVLSGLTAADRVVVEGSFLLKSALSKQSLGGGHSH